LAGIYTGWVPTINYHFSSIPGIAACLCLLFNLGYASPKFFEEPVRLLLKNKIIVKRK
jgi:peptidoglycan/LPS O-acetylase OafA/YrhL